VKRQITMAIISHPFGGSFLWLGAQAADTDCD